MPRYVGNVIGRDHTGVWARFDRDCYSCNRYCTRRPFAIVHLRGRQERPLRQQQSSLHHDGQPPRNQVELSMTLGSQCWLLLNSLLLPLIGFILGAAVSFQQGSDDPGCVLSSLAGMALGILLCQKFAIQRLKITEFQPPG